MAFSYTSVNPTENDVGGSSAGRVITETDWLASFRPVFGVVSGWTYATDTPSSGDIRVTAGTCVINGITVVATGTADVSTSSSTYWRLFLELDKTASLTTGVKLTLNTGSTLPTDEAIILCHGRTGSGGAITDDFDCRPGLGAHHGTFDGSVGSGGDSDGDLVVLGYRPTAVFVETNSEQVLAHALIDGSTTQSLFTAPVTGNIVITDYGFTKSSDLTSTSGSFLAWR